MSGGIRFIALRRCFIYIDENFFDFAKLAYVKDLATGFSLCIRLAGFSVDTVGPPQLVTR